MPVGLDNGQVLGTLAIFRAEPGRPTPAEEDVIARLSHMAGIVLAKNRVETSVPAANADLARMPEVFTVGATLASDVTQPLSGVAINASAGLRMLAGSPPDVRGAQETIRRTLRDCSGASETVARLRTLLAANGSKARPASGPPSAT